MTEFATLLFVALLLTALFWDVTRRRIPNALVLAGLVAALILRGIAGVSPLLGGLAGAGIALAATVPLFALGALGGGDAKLLAAVGGFTGPKGLLYALAASAIAGGVLGVLVLVRRRLRGEKTRNARAAGRVTVNTPGAVTVPYGAAIAAGSIYTWFFVLGRMPW